MEGDMACPKCKKPWQEVRDGKLICACGYTRSHIRTYPDLLAENVQLKKEIEKLQKQIEELTQNSTRTPPDGQQGLLKTR